MRDFNLRFFRQRWPDEIFDLLAEEGLVHLKEVAGTYVLGAADQTRFTYPWGGSPVFYIGKSTNLRKRLRAHRKWITRAKEEHDKHHFHSLHQYGAAFGVTVAIYRKKGRESIDKVESSLITDFYHIYGAIPVANGAWPKTMRQPLGVSIT